MRIFLSYPSELKSVAEPIAFSLRSRGHKVFLDRDDLPPGESYDDQIESAIAGSDFMIFLITPQSVEPGRYTLTELAHARRRWRKPARKILPVMVQPTSMDAIPSFLKSVTILEPSGNLTAEVSAAAHALSAPQRSVARQAFQAGALAVASFFGIGLLLAAIFSKAVEAGYQQEPSLNAFLLAAVLSLPMSMVLLTFGAEQGWRSLTAVLTMLPVMIVLSQDNSVGLQFFGITANSTFYIKAIYAFSIAAIFTALLTVATLAAASFASSSFRFPGRWLVTIVTTSLVCGLAMIPFGEQLAVATTSDTQTMIGALMIVIWLAVLGAFLGYWLAVGDPNIDETDALAGATVWK